VEGVPKQERCPDCGTRLSEEPWARGLCIHCLLTFAFDGDSGAREAAIGDAGQAPTELPANALFSGQILGNRYRIRSLLGSGGMGEVWRAFDLKLRTDVALKALRSDQIGTERGLELLRQEVRAARRVVSPGVCRVFDLVEIDGRELISMEYVDGTTLTAILRERSPLPLEEARDIASQFLGGLNAIHEAGLVHRDIKPENLMLTHAGRVVVMDFGIAKALEEAARGTVAGTPAYMAPEQARGERLDARADVFAAAMVLAEMVAPDGVRTNEARRDFWQAAQAEPPRIADGPWAATLRPALSRDRELRPASAAQLARALEEVTFRVVGADRVYPYPGLASFGQDDAAFFFGRELEVEALASKLRRPHLLGLIGPSGTGKSSFLRAGLLPALPAGWRAVVATPGSRPFTALAQALVPELSGNADATAALLRFEEPDVAVGVVLGWRRAHEEVVIIIDQFEELFTLNPREVQERFGQLLARLALESDAHVLLSMRDDFLFHCASLESLTPVFSELTPLRPLAGTALRRALVEPALKCGYRFEDEALVESMLSAVEGERGALPLLAFAAAQLWERRDREQGLLTRKAYEEIGGVAGALAQHAESTLDRIGSHRLPVVRELFRNLVTAQGTRAARDRDELLSVFPPGERDGVDAVLDTLVDARLLVSYEADAEAKPEA